MNRRAWLTPKQRTEMLSRQGGVCATPGCGSKGPRFIAEHTIPVALGNMEKPDCLLCRPCAHAKTYRKGGDLGRVAKAKRQARLTGPQKPGRKKRKINSPGFTAWRGMDGSIRRRKP